jgi:hypothetical protein
LEQGAVPPDIRKLRNLLKLEQLRGVVQHLLKDNQIKELAFAMKGFSRLLKLRMRTLIRKLGGLSKEPSKTSTIGT